MEKLIVDKTFLLHKYPGKGGWIYAIIDCVLQDKKGRFGMVRVKGSIDDYLIQQYNLMPMGSGNLFLPVKKEIRKKINKKEGETVHIILYNDSSPLTIPEELLLCLEEEPLAKKHFFKFTESEQKAYVDWINSAKRMDTKVNRIATTINRVLKGVKLHEKV